MSTASQLPYCPLVTQATQGIYVTISSFDKKLQLYFISETDLYNLKTINPSVLNLFHFVFILYFHPVVIVATDDQMTPITVKSLI